MIPRIRLDLGTFVAVVLLVGASVGLLRNPTRAAAAATSTTALFSLLGSIGLAIYRSGRLRARALGYLCCGGAYWLLTLGPPSTRLHYETIFTSGWLVLAEPWLIPADQLPVSPKFQQLMASHSWWSPAGAPRPFSLLSYLQIGHSLCTIFVALAGAGVFGYLQGTREAVVPSHRSPRDRPGVS